MSVGCIFRHERPRRIGSSTSFVMHAGRYWPLWLLQPGCNSGGRLFNQ